MFVLGTHPHASTGAGTGQGATLGLHTSGCCGMPELPQQDGAGAKGFGDEQGQAIIKSYQYDVYLTTTF